MTSLTLACKYHGDLISNFTDANQCVWKSSYIALHKTTLPALPRHFADKNVAYKITWLCRKDIASSMYWKHCIGICHISKGSYLLLRMDLFSPFIPKETFKTSYCFRGRRNPFKKAYSIRGWGEKWQTCFSLKYAKESTFNLPHITCNVLTRENNCQCLH